MRYPVVIHKDPDSDYGVTVPDLPGCFSAGSTVDEALDHAREAIELHLEGLIEDGEPVPKPSAVDNHQRKRRHRGGVWAVIDIDPANLRVRAKRVNITMPERILDAVDRYAKTHHESRSGLLARAATAYIRQNGGEDE
jgi:predicted RNase H-like HicB family nuclease